MQMHKAECYFQFQCFKNYNELSVLSGENTILVSWQEHAAVIALVTLKCI